MGKSEEVDLDMDSGTDSSPGKRKSCFKPPAGEGEQKGKDKHNNHPVSLEGASSKVEANSSVESAFPAGHGLRGLARSIPDGNGSGAKSSLFGASAVGCVGGGPAGAVIGVEPGE